MKKEKVSKKVEGKETMISTRVSEVLEKDSEALEKDLEVMEKDLMEKDSETLEKDLANITKLKCDYEVYKKERQKYKMPIIEKCEKCQTKFEKNDIIFYAYSIKKGKNIIICQKCANNDK